MPEFSCCPLRPCAFIEIKYLSCALIRMVSTNVLTGEYLKTGHIEISFGRNKVQLGCFDKLVTCVLKCDQALLCFVT